MTNNLTKKMIQAAGGQYGLKDLAAPFIQFKGSLGDCYREARGLGMCGIYRREDAGWVTVAMRYWNKFIPAKMIRNV